MKEIFLKKSFNFISSHKQLDHYNEVKIKYGLEVMYHFFTKLFVLVILSIIFNIYKEVLLFSLFYLPLRMYGCGIHAKSNIGCWVSSLVTYFAVALVIKYVDINLYINFVIYIFSFISMVLWAPADTSTKPIVNKHYRLQLKLIIITISLFYLILNFLIKNPTLLKCTNLSLLTQAISINPITYILCKRSYNNYKFYNC